MKTPPTMHKGYTAWWALVAVVLLSLEVAGSLADVPEWSWVVAMAALLALEAVAVIRVKPGDTLSEMLWTFARGGWSRGILVGSVAVYLALRFYMIGDLPSPPEWLPRAVLATGLGGWLVVHLTLMGRHG